MANKLAPRTFTCVVDMCGMKKLSDALAYNLPAAGGLNGRWNSDPQSPNFLAPGAQEIRFVGHPAHLAEMTRLGTSAKIVGATKYPCSISGPRSVWWTNFASRVPISMYFMIRARASLTRRSATS